MTHDLAQCTELHRAHGTTYFLSSRIFAPAVRDDVDALYGFVRTADEWVDNPDTLTPRQRIELLDDFEGQLEAALQGAPATHPVIRAFAPVVRRTGMTLEEPRLFLDAMRSDVNVERYPAYSDLEAYMRGSAVAVGYMMCRILGTDISGELRRPAAALAEAMQLTNFLRDIGEDAQRGRIYLPLEDLSRFGVAESDILSRTAGHGFPDLMAFEIKRCRALYAEADFGIARLEGRTRKAVMISRTLYSRILDRIEGQDYDVFSRRARTTGLEKGVVVAKALISGR